MKTNHSILVIGGGSIGKRHVRNLLSLGEKDITVVEVNGDRAMEIEKEFGIRTITDHVEEIWRRENEGRPFTVALICSPTADHIRHAIYCAKQGMHLFIEKPLSNEYDEKIGELLKLVVDRQLITIVGSNWKFYPSFQKMKELIDGGAIGKILSARCQFGSYLPDWHPWEDHHRGYSANKALGGGVLLDSHEFDYLTWFLGDVEKLVCFADRVGNVTVDSEDVAETILQFKNGAIGEIHLDYLQRFYQRNFEFFGEEGTMIWDVNLKKVIVKTKAKGTEEYPLPEAYDVNTMYVEEMKHFLDCIDTRQETIAPVAFGAHVLRLICAAKESAENKKIISIT